MTTETVKVQRPLGGVNRILVYNKDKSYITFLPMEHEDRLFLDDELKTFWQLLRVDNKLDFRKRVDDPGW